MTDELLPVTQADRDASALEAARLACRDYGYTAIGLATDVSDEQHVEGFTFVRPGQDQAAASWVSFRKAYYNKWDGTDGN